MLLILFFLSLVNSQILPKLNIDPNSITVSGISAGCFFAVQTHFAFSSIIKGIGCIAGGPYYCAQSNLNIALTQCMTEEDSHFINIDYLEQIVRNTANFGYVDPVSNLENSKVWLYSGLNDTIVSQKVVIKNAQLYERFLNNPNQIKLILDRESEHAQITNDYGNSCNYLGEPFINNCNYDAAGEQLNYLYGNLKLNSNLTGFIYNFSQGNYIFGGWNPNIGLDKIGFIYIPNNCFNQICKLHINFHGCEQTYKNIGLTYVVNSGYNKWADSNNIVILYPQSLSTELNPRGCFDWWGYTGWNYASNIGIQMNFIKNIINYFFI